MQRLWAPWRGEYITSEKGAGCVFCDAPASSAEKSLLLFAGSLTLVMLNKFPYNNGHLMVAPKRHVGRLEDLSPEESMDLFRLMRHCHAALQKEMRPEGFNIGMNLGKAAGAGIDGHIHMHIVPRWNGDTNFMPAISDTKVMPEHLLSTLSALSPHFKSL